MGPQNMRDIDRRRFHVRDVKDVIAWFEYRLSRDEQALNVIKKLRNSEAALRSTVNSMQRQRERDMAQSNLVKTIADGAPGDLQDLGEVKSVNQENVEILEELQAVIEHEAKEDQKTEEADEIDEGELENYRYFKVGNGYRYMYNNKLIAKSKVPSAVLGALLEQQEKEEQSLGD